MTVFERVINKLVAWLFFYRMIWVLLAIIILMTTSFYTWRTVRFTEAISIITFILTGGSIFIGIGYAILNYEIARINYRRDREFSSNHHAFHTALAWNNDIVLEKLKITKRIHEKYGHLILENNSKEFSEILDSDEEARAALISIFNLMECISLGVTRGVIDENFTRYYFQGLFIDYLNDYEFYISYRRKKHKDPTIWCFFTELATKWRD